MPTYAIAKECRERLRRAGWSMLEECPPEWAGDAWGVSGSRGGAAPAAGGAPWEEAWRNVCLQAEALGLLPRE